MAGKLTGGMKDLKLGNKTVWDSNQAFASKSILSYQNGSESGAEAGVRCVMESPPEKLLEDDSARETPSSNCPNASSECLDLLRKKLISDLSLQVFCTDLENKIIKMDPLEISKERLSVIQNIVVQINQLSDAERLLLYLKLPSSTSGRADPLRQPLNPLGNRQEIQQTIVWIKTHLEEDREISIPKQDVYDQYLKYCENISMKPLSTADFGKVMKQVYPGVRPRRLGTRGNSRYCYSGMRNTLKLPTPSLPELVHPSKLPNGVMKNGSISAVQENEKAKKAEKSKRKLKTTNRNNKISPAPRLFKSSVKDGSLKYTKRSKVENLTKDEVCATKTEEESVKEEFKYDDKSSNSLNTSDSCDFGSDLGVRFDNMDRMTNSVTKDFSGKSNLNFFNKINFQNTELDLQLNGIIKVKSNDNVVPECVKQPCKKNLSPIQDPAKGVNDKSSTRKIGYLLNGTEHLLVERNDLKSQKVKGRRSNSFSKSLRGYKKSYVPIQPKPVTDPILKVHFEFDRSAVLSRRTMVKKDSDVLFCEDSQEPEEEIVRYFQHLDEHRILGPSIVQGSVNTVVDNLVQVENASLNIKKFENTGMEANGQRSQSCFENQSKIGKPVENVAKFGFRSQSSLEFSGEQQPLQENKGSNNCDRDKISHLRLLLEKSIVPEFENNDKKPVFNFEKPDSVKVGTDNNSGASNFNIIADRKFPKLVMQRSKSLNDKRVPQSPNTSKYFNFTPISPGPGSPLKTPTTPLSSPFVSPRDTPVPRSRQNSVQNDHFLPPSKIGGDNDFSDKAAKVKMLNFQKTPLNDNMPEYQRTLAGVRPRSNSSTNFYRAKRNLSKVMSCDRVSLQEPSVPYSNNVVFNTCFPFPAANQNVIICDSSNDVRYLLGDKSTLQSATSRSQSVPLNRMKSECSWFSQQVSPVYSQYLNSENASGMKTVELSGFESEQKNLEQFISNEQMPGLSLEQLDEVFNGDNQEINNLVQKIGDHLFGDNFQSHNSNSANDNFNECNAFVQETVFTNKIDLNANATLPESFPNESDSGISENIKPFLQCFDEGNEKESKEKAKVFDNPLFDSVSDNAKDPLITSFKSAFSGEFSSCPNSPVLGLFGPKCNDDNQLIEFLGLNG